MRRRRAVGLALTLAAVVTLAGCASSPAATNSARDSAQASVANRIDALEKKSGGRLGVAVTDQFGKLIVGHRADERFAMCSTFKLLLAAQTLTAAKNGVSLRTPLAFTRADLLPHSPGAERLLDAEGKGEYRIGFAAEDAVVLSDNLAANLLLDHFGGPTAFTDHVQATGDLVTRLDRMEPGLNANIPGDPRDTTSPAAMAKSAAAYIFGDKLDPAYRTMLRDWLVKSETGLARIRAGLPRTWHVGDKTGTCRTAYNDVAFVEEPGGDKYMIAVYLDRPALKGDAANAIIADVARAVAGDRTE
ncbi:class A beta-lactamase [Sphingopyxis terrae]|uniref:class A beta-lactamase n=1 Tax=Sphingopyxis terrae TaxID=33052 RepID=UPI002A162939|nr:class A beta-lactamase [Sphingopyxis terrae]MDX8358036.1 class A beta-lactamase [Sphingopyxis terrae]